MTNTFKPTVNQKQNPELFAQATTKGHELGLYVATMGWVKADITIARAATGFVNRLPLNNLKLENELRDAFIGAAIKAAEHCSDEKEN
jgi:hypothetical protein